ncbi:MAG TPA: ComF family protein [Polyangiales bacterium]|nr:ComF family protein [Polyangiales bacterium]
MQGSIVQGFLWLLAPHRCPGCDLGVADVAAAAFCPACEPLLEVAPVGLSPPARAAACWQYQGPFADAIRRFKYGGAGWLATPLGAMLATAARSYAGGIQAVVPIPLHPTKLRSRGFNPAALLARPVAVELGVPLQINWLQRDRATRTQAGLSRDARLANLKGAFRAATAEPTTVLLIDDVRTTGTTLAEASAALTAKGHEVSTLALAWAPD